MRRRSGRRSGRMRREGEGEDEEQQFKPVYIRAGDDDGADGDDSEV